MKKAILIGSILAAFLMLMTPCISAVNVQATETAVEEKIETIWQRLETNLVGTRNEKISSLVDWNFPLLSAIIAVILIIISLLFGIPGKILVAIGEALIFLSENAFLLGVIIAGIGALIAYIGRIFEGIGDGAAAAVR